MTLFKSPLSHQPFASPTHSVTHRAHESNREIACKVLAEHIANQRAKEKAHWKSQIAAALAS